MILLTVGIIIGLVLGCALTLLVCFANTISELRKRPCPLCGGSKEK